MYKELIFKQERIFIMKTRKYKLIIPFMLFIILTACSMENLPKGIHSTDWRDE